MTNYVDLHGRWHVKPVTESNPFPTNNAYIYSFYAAMVGLPVDIFDFSEDALDDILDIDNTVISRHPGMRPPKIVPISHDEYVGLAGLDEIVADDIVEFGERHYFQYCDIPGFEAKPFRKLVLDDVLEAYEGLANEEKPRTAVIKYPALWNIAFWHRPEHQYFYYRCANRSPGLIRTLYFIIASLFTIFSKDSVSPMLGFKLKKLMQKPTLVDRLVNLVHDKYGNFKERCDKYFPAGHPILERL